MSNTDFDVDQIADAIGPRVSRRTVAKGVAWSLPVIASSIAAPAYAASPGVCEACVAQQQCILSGGGGGNCSCAPGLLCVGTGPLGLANVCVSTSLILSNCGATQCFGVCLSAGGAVISAFNTLMTAMSTFVNGIPNVAGIRTCTNQPGLPTNICISPLNDGNLGSMCIQQFTCGSTAIISVVLATLNAAVNTFIGVLSANGIAVASSCQSPYVCKDGASVAVDRNSANALLRFGHRTRVGICQCGPNSTCPDVDGFTVDCSN